MHGQWFDDLACRLGTSTSRRSMGVLAVGLLAAVRGSQVGAKKKKKKKATGCTTPNVACGMKCCAPGEPCVNGVCGCGEGKVYCAAVSMCLAGTCCPDDGCVGDTCCPAGATCGADVKSFATYCLCKKTGQPMCGSRCCPSGQTCINEECASCPPEPNNWDGGFGGLGSRRVCGAHCACLTSVGNTAACVDLSNVVEVNHCRDDNECTTRLGQPALCVQGPREPCPDGCTCLPAGCAE
ncbi:MAG: hypothetical protein U0031_22175 [Thermomicrobiales bacterium]